VATGLDRFDESRQRSAWLGLLAMPGATATGMSALALHRIQGLPMQIPTEVCAPGGCSLLGPPEVRVRRYRGSMPVILMNGFPVADVIPALAQALPEMGRVHGVAVLDSALHLGRISSGGLRGVSRLLTGRHGAPRAREYLALADGRAESPL